MTEVVGVTGRYRSAQTFSVPRTQTLLTCTEGRLSVCSADQQLCARTAASRHVRAWEGVGVLTQKIVLHRRGSDPAQFAHVHNLTRPVLTGTSSPIFKIGKPSLKESPELG